MRDHARNGSEQALTEGLRRAATPHPASGLGRTIDSGELVRRRTAPAAGAAQSGSTCVLSGGPVVRLLGDDVEHGGDVLDSRHLADPRDEVARALVADDFSGERHHAVLDADLDVSRRHADIAEGVAPDPLLDDRVSALRRRSRDDVPTPSRSTPRALPAENRAFLPTVRVICRIAFAPLSRATLRRRFPSRGSKKYAVPTPITNALVERMVVPPVLRGSYAECPPSRVRKPLDDMTRAPPAARLRRRPTSTRRGGSSRPRRASAPGRSGQADRRGTPSPR